MKPYSMDLRLRVVQAYENHEGSMRQLAARFRVSLRCVRDLLTRYRATGDVAPKPHGGGSPAKLDAAGLDTVRTLVQQAPDATLKEQGTLHAPAGYHAAHSERCHDEPCLDEAR